MGGIIEKKYRVEDLREIEMAEAPSLDLPFFVVDKVFMPSDGGKYILFYAHVDKTYSPEEACPICGAHNWAPQGKASDPRIIHDVTRSNYRVDITFFPPRMLCKDCGNKYTPTVKGVAGSRQMTTRLEDYLRKECFLQPFTQLAERSGFSVQTISSIMDEETAKYDKMREEHPLEAPTVLGIDEKHINDIMRGTIVDVSKRVLLDMFENNQQKTFVDGIKKLKDWDKKIKVVTTDMNNSYIPMIRTLLPGATIVIDKFHVIKDVEQCVTKAKKLLVDYRRNLIMTIDDLEMRAKQNAILRIVTSTPRLFNFSMNRLTREEDGERLRKRETVINAFPEFAMLHDLHFGIEHLYEQETREAAETAWNEWYVFLPPWEEKEYRDWCAGYGLTEDAFNSFRKFNSKSFLYFRDYILNYFNSTETRVTNAATEGLNSLIENVLMAGKGYEFSHLRAKCLYASLVHERVSYGIDIKTVKKLVEKQVYGFSMGPGAGRTRSEYKLFTEFAFSRKTEPVSLPLPSIDGDNEWLNDILFEKVDPVKDRRIQMAIADARSMMRAGIKFVTEFDRPEGDEPSIIADARRFYGYEEEDGDSFDD